jgi:hypothetical protein
MPAPRPFDNLRVLNEVEAQAQGREQSRAKRLVDLLLKYSSILEYLG